MTSYGTGSVPESTEVESKFPLFPHKDQMKSFERHDQMEIAKQNGTLIFGIVQLS